MSQLRILVGKVHFHLMIQFLKIFNQNLIYLFPTFHVQWTGCKRVIDFAVKIRVNSAKTAVETANVKHSLNPFDEIAVEEALQLRSRLGNDVVKEIIAVTCGPPKAQDQLRTALAMGADRAIHVEVGKNDNEVVNTLQPLAVAKLFKAIVEKEQANLVILGKQSIDDDASQTGPMLAGLLNWSQVPFLISSFIKKVFSFGLN